MPSALQKQYQNAVKAFETGNYEEVNRICAVIIQSNPQYHKAYALMAKMALLFNQLPAAFEFISQAIKISSKQADYFVCLASVYFAQNLLTEAEAALSAALKIQPKLGDASFLLGKVFQQQGRLDEAIACFTSACESLPKAADPHFELSTVALEKGDVEAAELAAKQAIAVDSSLVDAHLLLAEIYKEREDYEQSVEYYQNAIALRPKDVSLVKKLCVLLKQLNFTDEALVLIGDAIVYNPSSIELYVELAKSHYLLNNVQLAFEALHVAIKLGASAECWALFARYIAESNALEIKQDLTEDIALYLTHEALNPEPVLQAAYAMLQNSPIYSEFEKSVLGSDETQLNKLIINGEFRTLLIQPLFNSFLARARVPEAKFESVITLVRKAFLSLYRNENIEQNNLNYEYYSFLFALANQCFFNEYIFAISEPEKQSLELLELQLLSNIGNGERIELFEALLYLCYKPLRSLNLGLSVKSFSHIHDVQLRDQLLLLLKKQLDDPSLEKKIKLELPQLTPISDSISKIVRQQYEQNPYPRWSHSLSIGAMSIRDSLIQMFPYLAKQEEFLESESMAEGRILIAGCGSGKDPIETAMHHAHAKVLGVDLSLASLAYAERRRRELQVENLVLCQADILNLHEGDFSAISVPELRQGSFNMVQCNGVLHHMADPIKGWAKLCQLLEPGGVMKVGLYSELARQAIVAARYYIKEFHISNTDEAIKQCRQLIMRLPEGNPIKEVCSLWSDFYTLSTCRDLLFHVQEHRFTIPRIEEMLKQLDLSFIGFSFGNPSVVQLYKKHYPNDKSCINLKNWHELELQNPLIFKNMYQFWVVKPPT